LQARSYASNRRPAETFEREKAMHKASGRTVQKSSRAVTRALRLAAIALGIGLGHDGRDRRAQEDDEDDKTSRKRFIEGIMARNRRYPNMRTRGSSIASAPAGCAPQDRSADRRPPRRARCEAPRTGLKDSGPKHAARRDRGPKEENKDPAKRARTLTPSELNKGKVAAFRPHQRRSCSAPGVNNKSDAQPVQLA